MKLVRGSGLMAVLSVVLAACGQPASDAKEKAAAPAAEGAVATTGACGLLTLAEVKAVFPEAARNEAEESLADMGIHACDWQSASGARLVQVRRSTGSTVADELGTFEAGITDPMKPSKALPRTAIAGGEALVVSQDEAAGVLQSVAVAAVQKGTQTVSVVSSGVSGRPDAAESLGRLAQAAAARAN